MKTKNRGIGFFALVLLGSTIAAGYGQTIITTLPFKITTSGQYKLGSNLTGSITDYAINVAFTANVVIDMAGHTITNSQAGSGNCFAVQGSQFVTIKNGTISGFNQGVYLDNGCDDCVIEKLTLPTAPVGIYTQGDHTTIKLCVISGTGTAAQGQGILLAPNTTGVLAKENQISEFTIGIASGTGCDGKYNLNSISNCYIGLSVYPGDKYKSNTFSNCTTDIVKN